MCIFAVRMYINTMIRTLMTGYLCAAFLLTGCSAPRKTISGKADVGSCASIPFAPTEPVVSWQQTALPKANAATLPARARAYLIDTGRLDSFFTYARTPGGRSSFSIPLPGSPGCQYFELTDAGTLPASLATQYPKLVSLKGHAVHDPEASIRLDYDGALMRAEVIWGDAVYLVMPSQTENGTLYVVYQRQDTREVKQPFEQQMNRMIAEPAAPLPVK